MTSEYIVYIALETDNFKEVITEELCTKMRELYKSLSSNCYFPEIGTYNCGIYSHGDHNNSELFTNEFSKFTINFPELIFRIYLFYEDSDKLIYYRMKDQLVLSKQYINLKNRLDICDGISTEINIKYNDLDIKNDITDIITDIKIDYETSCYESSLHSSQQTTETEN